MAGGALPTTHKVIEISNYEAIFPMNMKTTRIVIFAKAPLPGLAKTRLIPALGAEGAAGKADARNHRRQCPGG